MIPTLGWDDTIGKGYASFGDMKTGGMNSVTCNTDPICSKSALMSTRETSFTHDIEKMYHIILTQTTNIDTYL